MLQMMPSLSNLVDPRTFAMRAEALVMLALASAAVRVLPFRRVAGMASRRGHASRSSPRDVALAVRAIEAWGRRVPWRAVCLQKGLALHLILRRRGIDSVMHYGVAQADGNGSSKTLAAHVWVSVDGRPVIGGEEAPRFACVASFGAA